MALDLFVSVLLYAFYSTEWSPRRRILFYGIVFCIRNLGVGESWPGTRRHPTDDRPVFVPTDSRNVTVDLGDRAVLKCRVEHLGAKTVTWRRQNEDHPLTIGLYIFAPDTRLGVDFNQRTDEWSLVVRDVRWSDRGLYHCQVTTKDEHENTYNVQLNVRTIHVTGSQLVSLGDSISLQCQAGLTDLSDQSFDLSWVKDGRRLRSDSQEGLVISKKLENSLITSWLRIQPSLMTHTGIYRCLTSTQVSSEVFVRVRNNTSMKSNIWHNSGVSAGRMASSLYNRSSVINILDLLAFLPYLVVGVPFIQSPATSFLSTESKSSV